MLKLTGFFFLFLFCSGAFAQGTGYIYVAKLKDKSNSPYSLSDPAQYLSERAIQRRVRQSIAINESDLPVNPGYISSIGEAGAKILNTSKWLNTVTFYTADSAVVPAIAAFPFVEQVVKIAKADKKSARTGNRALKNHEAEISLPHGEAPASSYGQSFNQVNMIGSDYFHSMGYRGEGMVIAVLDGGFSNVDKMAAFDSLRANNGIAGGWDFVEGNSSIYEDATHGTYVLSTMAANIPGQLLGTAPKATYWLLRTEDAGSEYLVEEYNWASAAEFADSVGADIINSSLGYTTFDDSLQNHTYAELDGKTTIVTRAANMAAGKGILVVSSAGNSGNSSWNFIAAPADGDSVLAIGAVNASREYVSFSSNGPRVDGAVKPDVSALGAGAVVADVNGGIALVNGTSFSSPITAGAAAVLWQANPRATNMQLIDAIERSANRHSRPDTLTGYGIPDFSVAHLLLSRVDTANMKNTSLLAFPNPAASYIELIFFSEVSKEFKVTLHDMAGRKASAAEIKFPKTGFNRHTLSLSALSKGMYLLNTVIDSENISVKIVKD